MSGQRERIPVFGMKAARRGVYSAPRGKRGPMRPEPVHGWPTRTSPHVRNEGRPVFTGGWSFVLAPRGVRYVPPSTSLLAGSGAPPPPMSGRVVFTCNTYSVPYKGKPRKKRLSPKSLNTLIHQCITSYIFLIFQYLSLWKSVFSSN